MRSLELKKLHHLAELVLVAAMAVTRTGFVAFRKAA
jgi:hypothetical protein